MVELSRRSPPSAGPEHRAPKARRLSVRSGSERGCGRINWNKPPTLPIERTIAAVGPPQGVRQGLAAAGRSVAAVRCCNKKYAIPLLDLRLHTNGKRWYAVCMNRAVAYYRVSTRQQHRSGLGIEAQRRGSRRPRGQRSSLNTSKRKPEKGPTRSTGGLSSRLPWRQRELPSARCWSQSSIACPATWRSSQA